MLDYDIINFDLGLKLMGGNDTLYKQVQTLFLEENANTLQRLEVYLSQKNYIDAEKLIHKVKSSSGSLGSEQVRITANMLQTALSDDDQSSVERLEILFTKQFQLLLDAITNYLNKQTT
jgi:HPt (histidine-containing phosphotransfer) domain-containing protein